jgi:hypothetical protein
MGEGEPITDIAVADIAAPDHVRGTAREAHPVTPIAGHTSVANGGPVAATHTVRATVWARRYLASVRAISSRSFIPPPLPDELPRGTAGFAVRQHRLDTTVRLSDSGSDGASIGHGLLLNEMVLGR